MARVALVFGYDLVLALVASVVLVGVGVQSPGLVTVIGAWLGPMALLSSLCLLLGVVVGPTVASTVVLALWVTKLLGPGLVRSEWLAPLVRGIESVWTTTVVTGVLSLAMLSAAWLADSALSSTSLGVPR